VTLIAILAEVMPDLQKKRAVAEFSTAFDAFAAANAFLFVDLVFKIRVFDISALNGIDWAAQILGRSVEIFPVIVIVPAAEQTIAASSILVDALNCRRRQYAGRCALSALDAFIRVNLPQHSRLRCFEFAEQQCEGCG